MRRLLFVSILTAAVLAAPLGVAAADAPPVLPPEPTPADAADGTPLDGTPVVVQLADQGVEGDAENIAGLLEAVTDGLDDTTVLGSLDLMTATVSDAALADLQASPVVEAVRPVRDDLRLLLDASGVTIGSTTLHASGFTGAGRVVAVIDSGVDRTHPGLQSGGQSSVIDERCFLDGVTQQFITSPETVREKCPNGAESDTSAMPCTLLADECTHGTAVAGVISGDDATFTGIAPDAGIMALRVTAVIERAGGGDYYPYISEPGVLAALEYVYDNRSNFDIAAVNLSLGGDPGTCTDPTWSDVVSRLSDAGIAVVAASGNDGWTDAISFPACLPGVISVGASTSVGEVASFTSSSVDLDLLAPGSPVTTTVLSTYDASGFAALQGTSFASPHVAAAFALLDQQFDGSWSVERRRSLLRVVGEMIQRPTPNPFDRDPFFPELRTLPVGDFVPFDDATNGYWVIASDWAKYTGVSTGPGGNLFAPDDPLTRAQAVTFLWRFMGSPDYGVDSGFSDVPTDTWYSQAVAWAAATGVTQGTDPGIFSPNDVVTRAQLATFMFRTAGYPYVGTDPGFADVPTGVYYTDAVAWMALHGITTGTSATEFSPDDQVTRAQMVTFEYRLADADDAWHGDVAPPALALF